MWGAGVRKERSVDGSLRQAPGGHQIPVAARGAGQLPGQVPAHPPDGGGAGGRPQDGGRALNVRDQGGQTPLHAAVVGGSTNATRELLARQADVNAQDQVTPIVMLPNGQHSSATLNPSRRDVR